MVQRILHFEHFVCHIADLVVPQRTSALEREVKFAELADFTAQLGKTAGEFPCVPCRGRANHDNANDADGEHDHKDVIDVAVQLLELLLLHSGLGLCSLVKECIDLARLLAQLCGRCRRRLNVAALVECDDLFRVSRVVVYRLAQLLTACLRVGVDRVLGKRGEIRVRLLECVLRIRCTARIARDDIAAQLTQPLVEVVLCLEQRDAVLDRDGEQMLIVRTRCLELIEHDGEQHDHQCNDAADQPCELQPDGHSLSHSDSSSFLFPHRMAVPAQSCGIKLMRGYFAPDEALCQSPF